MSLFKKTVLLASVITAFSAAAEKLEIGSKALSHIENVSSLKNFKPSAKDFRIYLIGDSITRHGFNKTTIKKLKWGYIAGMAASSENKDYAHLLAGKIGKMLPNRKIRLFFGKGNNSFRALTGIEDAQLYKPHLVVVQLGEHAKVRYGKEKVKANYQKLIDALTRLKPQPLIICTGVWSIQKGKKYNGWSAVVENIQQNICKSKNIPFASVEKYALDPQCSGTGGSKGVRWHPNDAGQAGYATAIFKLFKQHYGKSLFYKKVKVQAPVKTKTTTVNTQVPADGKIIYNADFNNGKSKLPVNPRRWEITDGSLSAYGNKMAQISLKKLDLKNFVLSCKLRLLDLPEKKDGHCGFIMSDGTGKSVRIYFRIPDVRLLIKENKKTIHHGKISDYKAWEVSPQARWNDIKLTVKAGHAELNVNGSLAGNFKFPINTVRNINIYSYIINCGIDDFKLTALPTVSAVKIKTGNSAEPAFYANYDGSVSGDANGKKLQPLTQNGTSFVPGVSGQAVFIGKKTNKIKTKTNKIKTKTSKLEFKYHGGITFTNGELVSAKSAKSMGSCEISGMNVPAFTLKFAAKRLNVPEHAQHFGIIIKQADGRSVRFYFDGKHFSILHMDGKKKLAHRHILRNFILKKGPASPWYDFSFKFSPEKITVTPPGQKPIILPIKNAPTVSAVFYAYKLTAAFKNISMTAPDGKILLDDAEFANSAPKRKNRGTSLLQYPAGKLFADSGTVMFWFQPGWDGQIKSRSQFPWYYLFTAQDAKGKDKLKMFLWNWLRCDLPREGLKPFSLQRKCRNTWLRDDWIHLAFTWNAAGWNKLYVNGLPYEHGGRGKREFPFRSNVSMKNITKFCVGSIPGASGVRKNADGAVDELKIYTGPLSDQAVMAEYHRFMPVEMVMERLLIPAGKPETLSLTVAPAGTFTNLPKKPVKLNLQVRLVKRDSNKVVWTKNYKLDLKKRKDLQLPVGSLPSGLYHLQCVVKTQNGQAQQSFKIMVYQPQPAVRVTDATVKLGKPFISIDCVENAAKALYNQKPKVIDNKYLQAAPEHGARFAFKVDFPDKYINNGPVMLEVTWPDTVSRSMGLYMFPESKKFRQHRDRLEGGIQSGEEYPLTNKMVTTKYLFYPAVKSYLFEARTFVKNMPAAVASFQISPLLEPLPELKINRPLKLPSRSLGHMDEDQSHDILFNWDAGKRFDDLYQLKVIRQTCDYFAYTGQNTISYPILRYYYTLYSRPGFNGGNNFLKPGFISLFLDIMQQRKMKFIGAINQNSLPEIYTRPDKFEELTAQGVYAVDLDGRTRKATLANPVHPFVRKQFLNQIREILLRFGRHPAFAGLDLWSRQTWAFCSLKRGYGDFTVDLFARETGVKVPDFKGSGRFRQRYDFLTGKVRRQWLKWRAVKSTEMVRLIAAEMDKINPELVLYVNPTGIFRHPDIEAAEGIENLNLEKFFYKNLSLDFKALNALPNVRTAAMRDVTGYRWCRHWDNRETIYDEILYRRGLWKPFLKNGSAPSWNYNRYFETFINSLEPKNYKSYFQNADIKPWGRFFLKEWAFCLAEMDSTMMLIGAQPLGTAGRDEVTREFAMAYRALPAVPFATMPGLSDPVTVRYLNKSGQTWLYAVNTSWSSVELTLNNISSTATELSSGKKLTAPGGKLKISLKPYQLRSFHMTGNIVPRQGSISIPAETIARLQDKITAISGKLALIKKSGISIKVYGQMLKKAQKELNKQHIATVMEIVYSKRIRKLNQLVKAASDGYLTQQAAMLKRGHIAVNCGSSAMQYFKAANGSLFLPDRPYAPGTYGYIGSYKTVSRNVSKIKGTADPGLFASEAYDVDEYRFTVKPGIYTVKLYFKHGWKPSAKPGKFVINVDIEGRRRLDGMDVFLTSGSDFDRAFVKTISNVKVKDGILNLKFSVPEGVDSTARLCNAIEVIAK